jgi:anti-sigma B factor antagonist
MGGLFGGDALLCPPPDGRLDIGETQAGRVVVIAVAGELDMLTAPQLDDAIHSALRKEPTALVVDLTRVDFLGSVAMNLLVGTHREITPTTRFGVVADGPATSRPIKKIGLDSVIALYQTLGEALAALAETPLGI